MVYGEYTRTSDVTDYTTYYHLVMADQAEEEHCTTPSGARGARPRQPKQRKIVTSPLSDTARRLLVVKCSAADQQQAATAPSIDNSFVLPASQPTPSVIRDMVGNQFPQLHVEEGPNSEWLVISRSMEHA